MESPKYDRHQEQGTRTITISLSDGYEFIYKVGNIEGYAVKQQTGQHKQQQDRYCDDDNERMGLGSCIAQYIRHQIYDQLGFTTSAGIAHSKQLSKLLASLHKPAEQSVWLSSIFPYNSNDHISEYPVSTFLSSYTIRQLSIVIWQPSP